MFTHAEELQFSLKSAVIRVAQGGEATASDLHRTRCVIPGKHRFHDGFASAQEGKMRHREPFQRTLNEVDRNLLLWS